MSKELDMLKNSNLFKALDKSVIEKIYKLSEKRTYNTGDEIYVENSDNDKIFFLVKGHTQGEIKLSDSGDFIIFKEGDFFGIEALMHEETPETTLTITALTDVCVLTWPASQWLQIFANDPKTGYTIMFAFAKILRDLIKNWHMNVLNHASWGIE